ncbi:VWA domain-containing protein [Sinomicrobium soli]|uniref:VWA domain-containing protein n=1 Tax=Sinomicrobium sp. N-1-3-6 TaxID=2219864 RepID=UPI000DCBF20A|nr:VWA domain-containing protein [Sinomicrobium sp. N-1-3-6]RAV30151.1 VWA domain-containing protein [Sinomicrobium sp. N-1-3-6]
MYVIECIVAGMAALTVAFFQYGRAKGRSVQGLLFAFLRFLSVFALVLLLLNPEVRTTTSQQEKATLAVLTDNSSSIAFLGQQQTAEELVSNIRQHTALREKLNVDFYTFGPGLQHGDSLGFDLPRTDIGNALASLKDIYRGKNTAVLLLTDGNRTYGEDYTYTSRQYPFPVFPVTIGDTTTYDDLSISRLNVNRYAYFRNKFPVEILLRYDGEKEVTSRFTISSGQRTLFSKRVRFSPEKKSEIIETYLDADSKGILTYKAGISPLENEKNTRNNTKEFGIEVIDEKTGVLIVSGISHPDLGALKRSIESNEEREVTLSGPDIDPARLNDYQLIILYQPSSAFDAVFKQLEQAPGNTFIIAGEDTDWNFLNKVQSAFSHESSMLTEEVQGSFNTFFTAFTAEDPGFGHYPPLLVSFGDVNINTSYETLLHQKVKGTETDIPLLFILEKDRKRQAVLLGENLWKWRMQDYRENGNFEKFDTFTGKLVFFLASDKKRDRLETEYETLYDGSRPVVITAQYFDRNYVFNPDAALRLEISARDTSLRKTYPMLLRNNYYQADLSDLEAGKYSFTVQVEGEQLKRSGEFSILRFDVEQQHTSANVNGLQKLAVQSGGKLLYPDTLDSIYPFLTESPEFKPVRKTSQKSVPLIHWKILLFIIIACLSAEWFLRKYRGLT